MPSFMPDAIAPSRAAFESYVCVMRIVVMRSRSSPAEEASNGASCPE
jgi:hypothetical protein